MDRKYADLYMGMAELCAQQSHALRGKVGAVVVSPNGSVISHGWNGMPAGMQNNCEIFPTNDVVVPLAYAGNLDAIKTRPEVLHAELNAIGKAAEDGRSLLGAILYTTLAPCMECAKLIHRSGIKGVVYGKTYREEAGLEFLPKVGVKCTQYNAASGDEDVAHT